MVLGLLLINGLASRTSIPPPTVLLVAGSARRSSPGDPRSDDEQERAQAHTRVNSAINDKVDEWCRAGEPSEAVLRQMQHDLDLEAAPPGPRSDAADGHLNELPPEDDAGPGSAGTDATGSDHTRAADDGPAVVATPPEQDSLDRRQPIVVTDISPLRRSSR